MNTNYKVGFYQTKTTGSQFAMRFLYDGTQHNVYALITSLTVKRLKKITCNASGGAASCDTIERGTITSRPCIIKQCMDKHRQVE